MIRLKSQGASLQRDVGIKIREKFQFLLLDNRASDLWLFSIINKDAGHSGRAV
jgi:hypothetical protein